MNERKLRIGFISNCPVGGKTGLAKNMRYLLPKLYKTNKYEIFFLAQGMSDGDGNFQKLPFKCEGVFKNFDQQRFNQDPNYQRMVSYGGMALESFVINNKLDCLALIDDQWAFPNELTLNTDWFNYMRENILPVITADSEPLLPQIIEWAGKCPNMSFWSDFAVRILKEKDKEKYKHCKRIYGTLNTEVFHPISKQEKLDLRHKFGISDDEKIIIYLGRNQLRKIFGSHIKGLAKFKKRNPDKKVRLLFFCSWSEPAGWPLNQIREQNDLKKEDILAPYYCRNCGDWNLQPFEGEELNCGCCNAQKSRITAGVGSSINDEDLNKIYNLCDGSASIFTSGSFEFTNPESMLAGVPLAVPNYVCGEDFINSGYVYEIKGTRTFESNTGFEKFVPDINSVCNFFEYIYNLPESKRKEITEKGRAWAIEQFDANNISKIYEKFFDSCKPIDWDSYLTKKSELKNPAAQVPNIQDDKEWLKTLYKEILKMEVKDDDSGLLFWMGELAQKKRSRQDIEIYFKNVGHSENMKKQNIGLDSLLDKEDKERVLLYLPQSLGDLYILTALLPEIKNKYPESSIYIGCDPKYHDIFDGNEFVKKCLPAMPEMENEMLMVGFANQKSYFNYYVHVGISTQKILNYLSNKY